MSAEHEAWEILKIERDEIEHELEQLQLRVAMALELHVALPKMFDEDGILCVTCGEESPCATERLLTNGQ